jgi:hypothetical protein
MMTRARATSTSSSTSKYTYRNLDAISFSVSTDRRKTCYVAIENPEPPSLLAMVLGYADRLEALRVLVAAEPRKKKLGSDRCIQYL